MTPAPRARDRWRAPRRLKVTATGRAYLVLTLGVGLGALNTGNNLLYLLLGLQLATIVVSGVLSERCLGGLVVVRLPSPAARAGEESHLSYRVMAGKSPAFALSMSEDGIPAAGVARLAYVAAQGSSPARAPLRPERRGPLRLSAVVVTTLYPLGLFAKSRRFDLPETLWVYPRQRPAPTHLPQGGTASGELARSSQPGGGGDLLGLKELGSHEDARRIHWLKSAAVGRPLQAERERELDKTVELELPAGGTGEALDEPCEITAALAQRYLEAGLWVGLRTPEGRIPPAGGAAQAHRILALLARAGYA